MSDEQVIDPNGIVSVYRLDGRGGGQPLDQCRLADLHPSEGVLWLHLDRAVETACDQAVEEIGLDPVFAQALLAEETRPRVIAAPEGMLLILRGVNTNPGSSPEDMVGIRLWVDGKRILSVRYRSLASIQDLRERIAAGHGPKTTGDFLVMLADRLVERMGPVIMDLSERLDELEDNVADIRPRDARAELRDIRHQAIILRRYLAPQRDVLGRLQLENQDWFDQNHKLAVREVGDTTARYVEELDAIRERAGVVHDEMMALNADAMNRTMYLLTLVATIILPLSLVTGLLGMNVGGIPLAELKTGFWWITGGLGAAAVANVILFRWLRWFR